MKNLKGKTFVYIRTVTISFVPKIQYGLRNRLAKCNAIIEFLKMLCGTLLEVPVARFDLVKCTDNLARVFLPRLQRIKLFLKVCPVTILQVMMQRSTCRHYSFSHISVHASVQYASV